MDAFIGEIRMLPYSFAPQGWLTCDGTMYSVQQFTPLYAVIGNLYAAPNDPYSNTQFRVPNLVGKAAMGQGAGPGLTPRTIGQTPGVATVTLTTAQEAAHSHGLQVITSVPTSETNTPSSLTNISSGWKMFNGVSEKVPMYNNTVGKPGTLPASTIVPAGAAIVSPHDNQQPYQALNFCICWDGYYPPPQQ